jgi:hypothetical protein
MFLIAETRSATLAATSTPKASSTAFVAKFSKEEVHSSFVDGVYRSFDVMALKTSEGWRRVGLHESGVAVHVSML